MHRQSWTETVSGQMLIWSGKLESFGGTKSSQGTGTFEEKTNFLDFLKKLDIFYVGEISTKVNKIYKPLEPVSTKIT